MRKFKKGDIIRVINLQDAGYRTREGDLCVVVANTWLGGNPAVIANTWLGGNPAVIVEVLRTKQIEELFEWRFEIVAGDNLSNLMNL
jgi:hypothetical protein